MAKRIVKLVHRKAEGVYTVTIPKAFVEMMGWDNKTEFSVSVDKNKIILKLEKRKNNS